MNEINQLTFGETTYDLEDHRISSIVDVFYPVGSIYMSVNSANPSTLFGGTWEQIEDTFLLAAGQTYTAGDTGGEAEHTLTTDEMPKHRHYPYGETESGNGNWRFPNIRDRSSISGKMELTSGTGMYGFASNSTWNDTSISAVTGNTGGNQAHNNMPPYLAVYMWKRTQ